MAGLRTAGLIVALTAFVAASSAEFQEPASDKGRNLVLDICSTCHELDLLHDRQLTKDQWSTFIKGMLDEGAAVTDEEFALIVEYLAKNFGPANAKEKNP
jgi:competence protein ComEA